MTSLKQHAKMILMNQLLRSRYHKIARKNELDFKLPSGKKLNLQELLQYRPELSGHLDVIMRDWHLAHEPKHSDIEHYQACIEWLIRSQETTKTGGYSAGYTFDTGWLPPYPETTGYIIPTLWNAFHQLNDARYKESSIKAADWEIEIQMDNGAIQAGYYGTDPSGFWSGELTPAAFNTGQVILGWNRAYLETKAPQYLTASDKASAYLAQCISKDGIFDKGLSPGPTNKTRSYYTRVAHALAWTGKLTNNEDYVKAARRYLDWVLTQQHDNGWFQNAQFHIDSSPLTHNLAYTAEGLLDAAILLDHKPYEDAALKHALAIQNTCERRGFFLPATLDEKLKSKDEFSCLTGNAQFAGLWLKLGDRHNDLTLINSGLKMVEWLKGVHSLNNKNDGIRGAIAGDWPIDGGYSSFRYLNWPTKFYADALLLTLKIKEKLSHV